MPSAKVLQIFPPGWGFHQPEEVFARSAEIETILLLDQRTTVPSDFPRVSTVLRSRYRSLFNAYGVGVGRITKATELAPVLRQMQPDVVVTYETYSSTSYQVSAAKHLANASHVVVCYETCPVGKGLWSRFPVTALFARSVADSADLFLVHTAKAREAVRSLGVHDSRIRTLNAGVVTDLELVRRSPNRSPSASFIISYMGPLRANKGIVDLIDAYEQFRESKVVSSSELWLAGDGPLKPFILDSCIRDRTIRYFGVVKGRNKSDFLNGTDAFVYPSIDQRFLRWTRWEEQLGVSLIEAMAAGCAVVVSDSGVLPEIVNRPGRVFSQGRVEAIVRNLIELARDRAAVLTESFENAHNAYQRFGMRQSIAEASTIIESLAGT